MMNESKGAREMEKAASISMDKIVYIHKDLGSGKGLVYECRYKDLANELSDRDYVAAAFIVGEEKKRIKQLQAMGYTVKITERTGTDAWDKVFADCVRI